MAGIDHERGVIAEHNDIEAANAPSRAKKVIRTGDVLFATTRPNRRNIAIVPPLLDTQICSTGFCVLRPKPAEITSGRIYSVVRSDGFVSQVVRHDETNAHPSVSDDEVRAVEIPVPPLAEQRRLGARLDALATKQAELRRLQTETEAEWASFTPALLAKAFRGELQ